MAGNVACDASIVNSLGAINGPIVLSFEYEECCYSLIGATGVPCYLPGAEYLEIPLPNNILPVGTTVIHLEFENGDDVPMAMAVRIFAGTGPR